MDKIISAVIALIGVIVTAIVTYLIARRESKLKYITEERQNWRNELREIAVNIESKNGADLKNELTKLKVRLNAYGMTNVKTSKDDSYYHQDSHIFKIINQDKGCFTKNGLELNPDEKEKLINYLSFLLKYDWERGKAEVKEGIFNLGSVVLFVLGFVTSFSIWAFNSDLNLSKKILISSIALYLFLLTGVDKYFYECFYRLKRKVDDCCELMFGKCFLIFVALFMIYSCSQCICRILRKYVMMASGDDKFQNIAIICLFFSSLIKILVNYNRYKRDKKYVDNLREYNCYIENDESIVLMIYQIINKKLEK